MNEHKRGAVPRISFHFDMINDMEFLSTLRQSESPQEQAQHPPAASASWWSWVAFFARVYKELPHPLALPSYGFSWSEDSAAAPFHFLSPLSVGNSAGQDTSIECRVRA